MKAAICTKYGAPEVLKVIEIKKPIPKDNEILIKIHTAAVTTAGLIGRTGIPYFTRLFSGLAKPRKSILGMEFSGEIEAIGKQVNLFKNGDTIFGLTGMSLGANAEYKCLTEDAAITKQPINTDHKASVAVIEGGLTALHFLRNKGNIQPGDKILINGASGSVGTASIQIAKYFGAEVTGVCSTQNIALVKSLGADHVIDYTKKDFTKTGRTYDVIFDTLGKRSFLSCRQALNPNGKFLDSNGLSTVFHMLWTSLFSNKKAILATTYTRSKISLKTDLIYLKALVETGKIKPVIDRCYPLIKIIEAHSYVETGHKKGNVILMIKQN